MPSGDLDPDAPLDLPIQRWKLSFVRVADASNYLQLGFWGDGQAEYVIDVEGDVALRVGAMRAPVSIRQRVGPYSDLIGLLGTECSRAQATPGGCLVLEFADGSTF